MDLFQPQTHAIPCLAKGIPADINQIIGSFAFGFQRCMQCQELRTPKFMTHGEPCLICELSQAWFDAKEMLPPTEQETNLTYLELYIWEDDVHIHPLFEYFPWRQLGIADTLHYIQAVLHVCWEHDVPAFMVETETLKILAKAIFEELHDQEFPFMTL